MESTELQKLLDEYVNKLERDGLITRVRPNESIPTFGEYMDLFYSTYKLDQESNTMLNRKRIIRNHIMPAFGDKKLDAVRTIDLQRYFNDKSKTYAKGTTLKIKNIMNPVFDSAVEDGYILRNPLSSKRLVIGGKECVPHKAIPRDKFDAIKKGIKDMPWRERIMGGLLCYTGMRFEEVLGTQWGDFDDEWVTVRRAVVHPDRNEPEVKCTKTKTSERKIPLHPELKALLDSYDGERKGFLLYPNGCEEHDIPLTYTEARYSLMKIRKKFGIDEYSAHDFRDSCATTWRENGIPLDMIARLLGHSNTKITEKRYVKYRDELMIEARDKM